MRICFLAPSGYGKSTAIEILKKHFNVTNIKIAEPMYELQKEFYDKLGYDIGDRQDGELLQFYGNKIRKENSEYLLRTFASKINLVKDTIILNDDCRPPDYEFLKELGFIFIKINGYKRDRNDISEVDSKNKVEWQSEIPYDYEIDNYTTIEEYEQNLMNLFNKLLGQKCYIIPTQNACNCNCIFCISKSRNYDKESEFLQVNEKFIANIKLLKEHGIKRFEITGGGEPLLNSNLQEIISTIRKIIPDCYIKLYTNGNILRKIDDVDEIDISVVSDDLTINNQFMNGNGIELLDKLKFYQSSKIKLRLSIPLIKGAIDNPKKLDMLIEKTKEYLDEYVVRTMYPNTPNLEELFVDFNYENELVIFERDNGLEGFNGILLWSDNKFYNSWDLNNEKHFSSYLLLKPDSKTYINEIEDLILKNGFKITRKFVLEEFKEWALKLYCEKDEEYLKIVKRHLESLAFLFGNNALILFLDRECLMEELYYRTLKLKEELREKFSFTHNQGGYLLKDNNISHLNIAHCPDVSSQLFDRDINILLESGMTEIDEELVLKLKKYRSYNL